MRQHSSPAYRTCLAHTRAERHLSAVVAHVLDNYGLTKSEWLVLALIAEQQHGQTNSRLAEALNVGLPHITALLKSLRKAGLVDQAVSDADRRANTSKITAKGLQLLEDSEKRVRSDLNAWLKEIPVDDRRVYLRTILFLSDHSPGI